MKFSLVLHPLFIAFALFLCACGYFTALFCYLITLILHEFAHAFMAKRLGYRLNQIKLMPYGASLSGENTFFCAKDEILIALAGPMLNFILAISFVAIWWIEPITYVYTLDFVQANLAVGLTNCLPVFPLDGGRVLHGVLTIKHAQTKATKIVKLLGIIVSSSLVFLFVCSVFFVPNYTVLIFASFLFVSSILDDKSSFYTTISFLEGKTNLQSGLKVREFAIPQSMPLYKLFSFIRRDSITNFSVLDKNLNIISKIGEKQLEVLIKIYPINTKLSQIIRK